MRAYKVKVTNESTIKKNEYQVEIEDLGYQKKNLLLPKLLSDF